MLQRDAESRAQELSEAAVLRLGRVDAIRYREHGREHRRQKDHSDGGDGGGAAEVRHSVVTRRLATLRAGHDVRQQSLVWSLCRVGCELKQEVKEHEPPVAAGQRDSREKEQVADRPRGDKRAPAAPWRDRAVGDPSNDWLPDDGHRGADPLEQARRDSLVLAADELDDHVRQDQSGQAVPEVTDRHPVERQDDEVEVVESTLRRGDRRDGQSGWYGGSDFLTDRSSR